ncbi:MAG TPA: selenium metabolism-associated LysR family transcriptional regulator [Thermodesulfovibrionales bacterium]|nr:selenium metabolism-associated LysR family transcriptional regulator [Thermodesulfovibrionales bacterium]
MEDHRLRAFCLAIEMKSFSKAAEAKFMTQSAMSHLVKKLEDELGVQLFIRKAKTVIPTPAGRLLYEHAKRILEQFKKMEDDILALMQKVKGALAIGADITAATYLLPQVFYGFSREYPEVKVDLSVSSTMSIMNDLHEGKIDIGVIGGGAKKSSVFIEEIAEDEIVIIASDDNPLTKIKTLTAEDLLSQPFIMPETGSGTRELIDGFLLRLGVNLGQIRIAMTLGNPELIVQMVQSGLGVAFVSKWSVFKATQEGRIRLLPLQGSKLRRKFYLVSPQKEPATMVAKTFRNFVRKYRFFVPF